MACVKFCVVLVILVLHVFLTKAQRQQCTQSLGMQDGRIKDDRITASSQASDDKAPYHGRLNNINGAWTSGITDYNQYLQIDLKVRNRITGLGTQGRGGSSEYVTEYQVWYSDNARDWMSYVNKLGRTKTFIANENAEEIKRNYFSQAIIARYIRINPVRWQQYISMRVELYGCLYVSKTVQFNGKSGTYIKYDISAEPIHTEFETTIFRFRTNEQDGVMFYATSSQGDYTCIELVEGKLYYRYNLGSTPDHDGSSYISAGSLLDDNLWHDVIIERLVNHIKLSVDRVTVEAINKGQFTYLDLDQFVYFGGVPHFNSPGITVQKNYRGCMESIRFKDKAIIELGLVNKTVQVKGDVALQCMRQDSIPVTFTTPESFIKATGATRSRQLNVTLSMRTYNDDGLIFSNTMTNNGWIKLFLENGKVKLGIKLANADMPSKGYDDIIDGFEQRFNDGLWHKIMVYIGLNEILIEIDEYSSRTERLIDIRPGAEYMLGGGRTLDNDPGFLGCMRYIYIEGRILALDSLEPDQKTAGVVLDSCSIIDRCNPNPCEHGGICQQDWGDFTCECGTTGYTGATCHTSIYKLSCEAVAQDIHHQIGTEIPTSIDLDGSGPMKPFPVICNFDKDGKIETILHHFNEEKTLVTGFPEPGSYRQYITYDADEHQIHDMMNRSVSCRQLLSYECRGAQLLNTFIGRDISQVYNPYTWWVGRTNQKMGYWGGASPGSGKCQCGVTEDCIQSDRYCNCDAGRDTWEHDSGYIHEKEFLPVMQLRVGDTGSVNDYKQAYYQVGPLICEGDNLFENMATFRLPDATINFGTLETGRSFDIQFQFKTTVAQGIMMECIGPQDNFVRIKLGGEQEIQFLYNAGTSIQVLSVRTPERLDNDVWHTVLAERNRKEARLLVDNFRPTQLRESAATYRDFYLTSDFVVGASVSYEDGFVGVIRGLMVNGVLQNLRGFAEEGLYGVSPGDVPKCASNPCLNNGTCLERYSHFECDCAYTAFRGPICTDDIGIDLHPSDMIRFDFPDRGMRTTVTERIHVGFSSVDRKGLLMQVRSTGKDVFSMELQQNGGLKFRFFYGWDAEEINDERIVANGQHHDVIFYRRDEGATLVYKIDDYEERIFPFKLAASQDTKFNQLASIYVGRNETMGPGDGFRGCISRMSFDDQYPLKAIFYEPPLPNVHININGTLRQSKCNIEPYTHAPEIVELRPPSTPPPYEYEKDKREQEGVRRGTVVLIVILIIIFILLLICLIILARFILTEKGTYQTQEDVGAEDAHTADQAVVRGPTGMPAAKKKEYFL